MTKVPPKNNWPEKVYLTVSQDELLVAALASIEGKNERITFERLVAQCFEMFPKKFELQGYHQWPNAVIVNKSWLRCRSDKKLIQGNVAEGFTLTPKGAEFAKKVFRRLGIKSPEIQNNQVSAGRKADRQTASGRVVLDVEKSNAYLKYKKSGSVVEISEHEACEVFYAMVESEPETLRKNYEAVKQHVENYGRDDLMKFLNDLREKFSWRFTSSQRKGGMLPRS